MSPGFLQVTGLEPKSKYYRCLSLGTLSLSSDMETR